MDGTVDTLGSQWEVLRGLDGLVRENLSPPAPVEKAWQPTDYLPDLTALAWKERLPVFREPAVQVVRRGAGRAKGSKGSGMSGMSG